MSFRTVYTNQLSWAIAFDFTTDLQLEPRSLPLPLLGPDSGSYIPLPIQIQQNQSRETVRVRDVTSKLYSGELASCTCAQLCNLNVKSNRRNRGPFKYAASIAS
eukprot:3939087-Rhodomonas_salina.1